MSGSGCSWGFVLNSLQLDRQSTHKRFEALLPESPLKNRLVEPLETRQRRSQQGLCPPLLSWNSCIRTFTIISTFEIICHQFLIVSTLRQVQAPTPFRPCPVSPIHLEIRRSFQEFQAQKWCKPPRSLLYRSDLVVIIQPPLLSIIANHGVIFGLMACQS